jgi:hypothetical protein
VPPAIKRIVANARTSGEVANVFSKVATFYAR